MDKWKVLGIDKTKDIDKIKNAYRNLLVKVNPEDDAEGFMQLRNAYQEALSYAQSEETEEQEEEDELKKYLSELYSDFGRRINPDEWQKVLNRDEFISLDTSDYAKNVLLEFIMEKNYLPHDVFKLIAENLDIRENRDEFVEKYPERLIDFIIANSTYKDTINYALFDNPSDDVEEFISTYYELDNALRGADLDEEQRLIEKIEGFNIYHPYIEVCKLWHYLHEISPKVESKEERIEKHSDEMEKIQRQAEELLKKYPEDSYILISCGDFAMLRNAYSEAGKHYSKAEELEPEDYSVKDRMGNYYYAVGEYEKSRDIFLDLLDINGSDEWAMTKMMRANDGLKEELINKISENPDDDNIKIKLAWCYYRNNLLDEAVNVLNDFTPSDENRGKYYGLLGRNLLYNDEPEKALECFFIWKDELENTPEKREGKKWRYGYVNSNSACYFIAECYIKLKKYDEARPYLEKALSEENALMENAKELLCALEYDCGKYQRSIAACKDILKKKDNFYAYLYMAKSFYMLDEYEQSINACEHALSVYAYAVEPYDLMLSMFWDWDSAEDMERVIGRFDALQGKSDKIELQRARMLGLKEDYKASNEVLLGILERVNQGESDLRDIFDVYGLLATNLSWLGDYQKSLVFYQETLKCDPGNKNVMCRIAGTYHILGEFEKSISIYEKVLKESDRPNYRKRAYTGKAAALCCMKKYKEASDVYTECEEEFGLNDNYVIDHAEVFIRMNNFSSCVEFMENCISELKGESLVQYLIGNLCCYYGNEGRIDDAYKTFLRALKNNPDDYLIYRSMGLIYLDHEMYEEAKEMFLKAIELDTEMDAYILGPYLMAVSKTDDITKPEYKKYIDMAIEQVKDADDDYTYIRKAEVYLGLGEYDTALQAISDALAKPRGKLALFKENHHAWYVRGLIYEDMGENEKALESYKRALEIYGHDSLYEEKVRIFLEK